MRIHLPLCLLFLCTFGFAELQAQSTKGFNYQAVARDNSGATLDNTSVSLRFQIRDGGPNGTLIYQETHASTTNAFGVLNTQIGKGTAEVGDFSTIDWAADLYLLVALNGSDVDTTLLESVPYAKMATDMRLDDLKNVNVPTPSINQVLTWEGSSWVAADNAINLSGTGATSVSGSYPNFTISSTDNVNDADADPNNEMQSLSLSGNNLSISNGNSVALPSAPNYTAGSGINLSGGIITNSAPDQTVNLNGNGATSISGSYPNFTISSTDNVNDADADPNNEIQSLSLSGNNLSISSGNSVALPSAPSYTAGSGINISGGTITNSAPDQAVSISSSGATTVTGSYPNFTISSTDNVNDADASTTNEIQSLSLSGNTLSLSQGGGSVNLNTFTSPWSQTSNHLYFNSGRVGIGDNSPVATLTVGNGDKFQVHGAEGDVIFKDDQASIRFAKAVGPTQPMMQMFANGVNNSTRMVLAHSPSFSDWGLRYNDTLDAFTFIGDDLPALHIGLIGYKRVGVGTETPEAKLHVVSNSTIGVGQLKITEEGQDYARITMANNIHSSYWDIAAITNGTLTGSQLNFFNSTAGDILTINARGRVGLNVFNPDYTLDIDGNGQRRAVNINNEIITSAGNTYNYGVFSSITQVPTIGNARLYALLGRAVDVDGYLNYGLYGFADDGSQFNYGVYGYAPTSNGYAGYFVGNVYTTGSYLPSDSRLKSNIEPLNQGLKTILQLEPKQYAYKQDEFGFMNLPEGQQYGFLAQDLQQTLPVLTQRAYHAYDDVVSEVSEDQGFEFTAVNYIGLIPIVVSAMQEQQDIIETQNAKIESLEARLAALEALLKE